MSNVIELSKARAHQRATRVADAGAPARESAASLWNVIPLVRRSLAKPTSCAQRAAGMPRTRQPLTVDSQSPNSSATLPVPPSASMIDPGVSMDKGIVRTVRTCQPFATREPTISGDCGAILAMNTPLYDPPEVIGPRLLALRLALGFEDQSKFAEKLGVKKNTYNPWEKGTRPLTFDGASRIRREFRIPLDYLFHGQFADELPAKIRNKIGRAA